MLSGKHTQIELARKFGVPPSTTCRWAKEVPELQYLTIRNRLIRQVKPLTLKYGQNSEIVFQLVRDIETIESLIKGGVTMAYNKRNLLLRIIEIQDLTLKHTKEGYTQKWVYNNFIHSKYKIAIDTYYKYLNRNAKMELSKMNDASVAG